MGGENTVNKNIIVMKKTFIVLCSIFYFILVSAFALPIILWIIVAPINILLTSEYYEENEIHVR